MSAGMVIVGAGECGVRAALALRERGYEGVVTLIGLERHAPYERPPMSKHLMVSAEMVPPKTIATLERLADAGITLHLNTPVTALDRTNRTVAFAGGPALPYEKLLLATGARPRTLPFAQGPHVVTLRTHEDAVRIRQSLHRRERVAIIGGGFIGLELAAAARQLGADVTVLESLSRVLSRGVPQELATVLEARHRAEGVTFRLGCVITAVAGKEITFGDGDTLTADLIVVSVGAQPETSLAQAAGLTIDNGVAVNNRLQTSDPDIFAAGDCCSFPLDVYGGRRVRLESWRSAQDQGNCAAHNMLGADEPFAAVPWLWSDQYDLTLQVAGLSDEGEVVVERVSDNARILFHLKRDGRIVAATGLGIGTAVAKDVRLAEMLIARRATPDATVLADPAGKLKSLLQAAS